MEQLVLIVSQARIVRSADWVCIFQAEWEHQVARDVLTYFKTLSALEQHKMAMWGRLMSHHANKPPVGDWYPTHYHTFYQKKRNYQYPNNKIPAGVIQYPYYTLRGPTDFFMK